MKSDDSAQLATELFEKMALDNAKVKAISTKHNTRCLNCESPVQEGHAYCDSDCREDHEWRQERLQHKRRV